MFHLFCREQVKKEIRIKQSYQLTRKKFHIKKNERKNPFLLNNMLVRFAINVP